jgi:hypothetical protein
MNSTLCHGVTLKGVSCSKRTRDPSQLCHLHRKKGAVKAPKPQKEAEVKGDPVVTDECCVCFELMPVSDATACKHMVCKRCIKKISNHRCPMCRAKMNLKKKSVK